MLAGRESLIRLVGKRRRKLPRDFLLLDPLQHLPLSLSLSQPPSLPNDAGGVSSLEKGSTPVDGGGGLGENGGEVVCRRSIQGVDCSVNSHLDSCLERGTKRKLTQRTLLDFVSRSTGGVELDKSETVQKNRREQEMVRDDKSESDSECLLIKTDLSESSRRQEVQNEALLEKITRVCADSLEVQCPSPLCSPSSENDIVDLRMHISEDDLSAIKLETVIVGRKYHDKHEPSPGSTVYILRDPENVKDNYALKVTCRDSGELQMLGYLPKELSKYLSPLIDQYNLKFEGSVISCPKHEHDIIPVQIQCQGKVSYHEMIPDCIKHLNSLWGNVLQVIEHGKTLNPNMPKYQKNFLVMIQEVLKQHGHLFMENEKLFLENFESLSDDGQRIFIRLYTRKGPWFRTSNISYPEVHDPQKAIEELQLKGYVCPFLYGEKSFKSDISEVLSLLTVLDLRKISSASLLKKCISCTRKQVLVNWLSASYRGGTCPLLPEKIMERAGTCVKVSFGAELLLWRVQRLFFLDGEHDLSAFLLVDLGVVKYPSYICNVSQPIFRTRNDLLAYEQAIAVAQILDESIEANNPELVIRCINFSDSCISLLPISSLTQFTRFSSSWVYSKVITVGISYYEHEKKYKDAVKLLKGLLKKISCGGKRGYWSLRLSIDLEHMGYKDESLSVAEEGLLDPWVRAGSRLALQRRVLRLGKPPRRWKKPTFAKSIDRQIRDVHVIGRPLNCETGTKNRYYGYDGLQCGVENLALQYYSGEGGWKGIHAESGIWMTIFGLLFWDIIFCDISDVFHTRFQTAPLDFGTDHFYLTRRHLIDSHLTNICNGMAEEILICSYESHQGISCMGVQWDQYCLSDLRAIVACIGCNCLASLCRHLAQDYRSWSHGMPDLLLWRFNNGDGFRGEAKLVEVKGPRDRLSEQQRAWMLTLMDYGFNTEICRISPHTNTPMKQ